MALSVLEQRRPPKWAKNTHVQNYFFSISSLLAGEEPCQFFQELVWPNRTHTTVLAQLEAPLYQAWVGNGIAFHFFFLFVCFGNHVLRPFQSASKHCVPAFFWQAANGRIKHQIHVSNEKIKQHSIKSMFQVQEKIQRRSTRVGCYYPTPPPENHAPMSLKIQNEKTTGPLTALLATPATVFLHKNFDVCFCSKFHLQDGSTQQTRAVSWNRTKACADQLLLYIMNSNKQMKTNIHLHHF